MTENFFKHIEAIEAKSAKDLASKLRSIKIPFQIANVWTDGKLHYALINAGKKIPVRTMELLTKDPK
jgi:hypothetical protein